MVCRLSRHNADAAPDPIEGVSHLLMVLLLVRSRALRPWTGCDTMNQFILDWPALLEQEGLCFHIQKFFDFGIELHGSSKRATLNISTRRYANSELRGIPTISKRQAGKTERCRHHKNWNSGIKLVWFSYQLQTSGWMENSLFSGYSFAELLRQ